MLLRLLVCFFVLNGFANISAQPRRASSFGLGLTLIAPTGISANVFLDPEHSLACAVGWGDGDVNLYADYLFYKPKAVFLDGIELDFYLGPGLRVAQFHDSRRDTTTQDVGVRMPLGLSYFARTYPLQVFGELAPAINLIDSSRFLVDLAVGGRFLFLVELKGEQNVGRCNKWLVSLRIMFCLFIFLSQHDEMIAAEKIKKSKFKKSPQAENTAAEASTAPMKSIGNLSVAIELSYVSLNAKADTDGDGDATLLKFNGGFVNVPLEYFMTLAPGTLWIAPRVGLGKGQVSGSQLLNSEVDEFGDISESKALYQLHPTFLSSGVGLYWALSPSMRVDTILGYDYGLASTASIENIENFAGDVFSSTTTKKIKQYGRYYLAPRFVYMLGESFDLGIGASFARGFIKVEDESEELRIEPTLSAISLDMRFGFRF